MSINVGILSYADQGASIPEAVTTVAIDQFCSQGHHLDSERKADATRFYQSPPDGAAWSDYVSGDTVEGSESIPADILSETFTEG